MGRTDIGKRGIGIGRCSDLRIRSDSGSCLACIGKSITTIFDNLWVVPMMITFLHILMRRRRRRR
jgi:hypothetical protein